MAKNTFSLDFRDNPELKNAFAQCKVGEKVTFEVTAQVDNLDDEQVSGTIESITKEGYENPNAPEGEKGEVKPDVESPVMLMMKMGGKQDSGSSAED